MMGNQKKETATPFHSVEYPSFNRMGLNWLARIDSDTESCEKFCLCTSSRALRSASQIANLEVETRRFSMEHFSNRNIWPNRRRASLFLPINLERFELVTNPSRVVA